MQWLIDAPDVTVNACLEPLGGLSAKGYAHFAEIVAQYTLAMAAFIIENPGKANDPDAATGGGRGRAQRLSGDARRSAE